MNDYNFWADLLFTFQSSPDWIKALWLLVPPGFVLAVIAMMIRFGLALRQKKLVRDEFLVPVRYQGETTIAMPEYPELAHEFNSLLPLLPRGEKVSVRTGEGDEERKRRMS